MAKSELPGFRTLIPLVMAACFCVMVWTGEASAFGEKKTDKTTEPRYGLGISLGLGYDPSDARNFMGLTGIALYDYEAIWPHRAPDQLRFKLEGSLGGTICSGPDFFASAGFLALYYFDGLSTSLLQPYIEGGVGLIFTEHKVKGQGSRINFNPQAGLGMDISPETGPDFWVSLRLHHLSNAGLKKDNRGVNSLVLQGGKFF